MDAASTTYSISINEHTSKSLGIVISQNGINDYVVSDVTIGSLGDKMGISIGDSLLSINDVMVPQILHPPSRIASILSEHKAPFTAKFMKCRALQNEYNEPPLDPLRMTLSIECDDKDQLSTDDSADYESLAMSPRISPQLTESESTKLSDVPAYSPLTQSFTPFLEGRDSIANADEDEESDAFSFENETEPHSEHEMIGNMKEIEMLHRLIQHSTDKMTAATHCVHFDALKVFPALNPVDSLNDHQPSSTTITLPSVRSDPSLSAADPSRDAEDDLVDSVSDRIVAMSSNGLSSGYYEWTVTILKSDVDLMEIGIVSNGDLYSVDQMAPRGVKDTKALSARAVFGNELSTASLFRASYNDVGNKGVFKDLSTQYNRGWCTNDQITVCLDFTKNAIKFLWNGQKVKSMMRIQKGLTYYPVIAFSGNCQFHVH